MLQIPPSLDDLFALAAGHQRNGELGRAAAIYGQILQQDPNNADALHQRAIVAYQSGDRENAILFLQRAVRLAPTNEHFLNNLGMVYQASGRLDEAIAAYRSALRYQPNLAAAHSNLGSALADQRQYAEAERHCHEAIRYQPDLAAAHNNLGRIYFVCGKHDLAKQCFEQAVHLSQAMVDAHRNLGHIYRELGRFEEARREYEIVLNLNPRETRALYSLSLIKKHRLSDQADLDRLETRLEDPLLGATERAELNFGLGKICDECGLYDKAFRHFQRANSLVRPPFDRHLCELMINQWMTAFTRERFAGATPGGSASELPVFIVGMPRSGTSLVEQILSSHPQVYGAGELSDLQEISTNLERNWRGDPPYPFCLFSLGQADLAGLAEQYLSRRRAECGDAVRVTDKMPANFLLLGLIPRLFPNARVIHCVRDPRDTCLSCYFTDFASRPTYAYDLEDLGFFHRTHDRLMSHWRSELPVKMIDVSYEDLVARPEEVSRQLLGFCGLEWDDRCLRFFENARPVRTASGWQVRQPMYNSSVGRWRHYEKYLGGLVKSLGLPPT
jgi:tetratricopeptide (TPR) repeat protein